MDQEKLPRGSVITIQGEYTGVILEHVEQIPEGSDKDKPGMLVYVFPLWKDGGVKTGHEVRPKEENDPSHLCGSYKDNVEWIAY